MRRVSRNSLNQGIGALGISDVPCRGRSLRELLGSSYVSERVDALVHVSGAILLVMFWLAVGLVPLHAASEPGGLSAAPYSLVMIEEEGCAYCLKWHQEVGPGYPRSAEGRKAPLVTYDRRSKDGSRYPRVVFTPTFILISDNKELGRINGYPGADFFWSMLGDMLRKTDKASAAGQ